MASDFEKGYKESQKMLDDALAKLPEEKRKPLSDFRDKINKLSTSNKSVDIVGLSEELKQIYKTL